MGKGIGENFGRIACIAFGVEEGLIPFLGVPEAAIQLEVAQTPAKNGGNIMRRLGGVDFRVERGDRGKRTASGERVKENRNKSSLVWG